MKSDKFKKFDAPIIQGGMGVGISMGRLAGAVAREGGMGVISTALIGFREKIFYENHIEADKIALRKEIRIAKEISQGKGLIAINVMTVTKDFGECVKVAIEEGVDAVISGAGLPLSLPKFAEEAGSKDVLLAPIVSSGKAARLIIKLWMKNYNVNPDFIVVEGRDAGGHLGFKKDAIIDEDYSLEKIVREVISEAEDIPIFVGGSIFDEDDIRKAMSWGAAGVQIGTRFIGTFQCDASKGFKEYILKAKKSDLKIIKSPVGMPGRAIKSKLLEDVETAGRKPPVKCINCITSCKPGTTPYCISQALIAAYYGDEENGLFFSGANVDRINELVDVKDLMEELKKAFD